MFSKYALVIVCLFVLLQKGYSRPKSKLFTSNAEGVESDKEWEKKKPEISFMRQLEESGLGVKRIGSDEEKMVEGDKINVVDGGENPPPMDTLENLKSSEDSSKKDTAATRVKKQSSNNVCIKIGGCGKTVCGPIVSARGPVVSDVRAMLQNPKPLMDGMDSLSTMSMNDMKQTSSKIPSHPLVQGRTVDLMGLAPTVTLGYGTPAIYSNPVASNSETSSLGYGHTFIKPPSIPTVSAVPVAVITQHQPHHVVHPWFMPHLMPHIMPHVMPHIISGIMPSLTSFITPHRLEPQRFPEVSQNDFKQPVPPISQFSYASPDTALICQPVRNQRYDNPYDFIYKPDVAADKSLNVTETSRKAILRKVEEDSKIQDHLRKVNEIKEEITQLNRAAQRIVDQQEKLTEMQQKQLWGASPASSSSMHSTSDHPAAPYMGSGYYPHPTMPWGYSRSNILSYPNTQDDINFFLNLLKAGRKFGAISDSIQPVLTTVGEVIKGSQDSAKMEKEMTDVSKAPNLHPSHPSQTSQPIKPL